RVGPAAWVGGSGAPVQHGAVSPGDPSARGNRWSERAGLMGDSLRSELEVPLVEASQQPVVEVETPHAVCDLLQAQVLVRQRLADEELVLLEADVAVLREEAHLEVTGVLRSRHYLGHRARRWGVDRGRRSGAERLMGPLLVELAPPAVEALLLRGHVPLRWPGRLRLQGLVHPLVSAVLLRLSGVDAVVRDPELDPPHRELGEAADGLRGERHAVVGADGLRQPVLVNEPG